MNTEYRVSNIERRARSFGLHRYVFAAVLLGPFVLSPLAGCDNNNNRLTEQIVTLTEQKLELTRQLGEAQAANEQAKKQIQVLSGLSPGVRLENLYDLQKVKIGGYTNLYDRDKDGRYEELIVYLQPVDAEDDIVKATGTVEVQLWDLDRPADKALLAKWSVAPAELKKMWFATLITINFRLIFDVSKIVEKYDSPLTVKVKFTDYLSGKVFAEQKVIEPAK